MLRPILSGIFFLTITFYTFGQELTPETTLNDPYNTVLIHLYYLQPETYEEEKAAESFNPSLDLEQRKELAVQLKHVLDGKGLYVRLGQIPRDSNYIDTTYQRPIYYLFPDLLPQVYVEKTEGRWYYSSETNRAIPALYEEVYPFGADLLLSWFPKARNKKFAGLAIWQYLGLVILVALAIALYFILCLIIHLIFRKISTSKFFVIKPEKEQTWKVVKTASLLLVVRLFKMFLPTLVLPIRAMEVLVKLLDVLSIILLVVLALRILNIIMKYALALTETTESKMDEEFMPILNRVLQVLVVILLGIAPILKLFNFDPFALLAGLSLGGLALALAAQDTVKNLIGSATIFFDKPFQIGDWIEGDNFSGTVVEVGVRTTRIQRPDSSIVSVPNGAIANMKIHNLGVRIHRLLECKIGITYDTPTDLIEEFIQGLNGIVKTHPYTSEEGSYVNFNELADSSLNIFFRTQIHVNDYQEELKAKEEILLAILRLGEHLGVSFAFPSTSVYIEGLPPGEEKNSKLAKDEKESLGSFLENFRVWLERNKKPEDDTSA